MASATKALGDDVPEKSVFSSKVQEVSSAATHYPSFIANPSFVQIRGNRGSFALIAADVNGIALYDISRDNANPKHPWTLNTAFGEDISRTFVAGISLIEGPFGSPGNLEVVINGGGRLLHLWRDSAGSWKYPTTRIAPATAVIGFPSLIQTKSGTKGDFELIAAAESGGLLQLWRNNDNEHHPWSSPVFFGQSLKAVTSVSVIQGPYGNPGNLELVVISGGKLFSLWRRAPRESQWNLPTAFLTTHSVRGNAALIQSKFGQRGNFELVVPAANGGLLHFQRNNDIGPPAPWGNATSFGTELGIVTGVSLIQSDLGPSSNNLEVIANVKGVLQQFWREPGGRWQGPQAVP